MLTSFFGEGFLEGDGVSERGVYVCEEHIYIVGHGSAKFPGYSFLLQVGWRLVESLVEIDVFGTCRKVLLQ